MTFDSVLIMESLKIMALGMSGIFLVLSLLYLFSMALLKLFPAKKDDASQ